MRSRAARRYGTRIRIPVPAQLAEAAGLDEIRYFYLCRDEHGAIRVYRVPRAECIRARAIILQKRGNYRYYALSVGVRDARSIGLREGVEYAFIVESFTLVPLEGEGSE